MAGQSVIPIAFCAANAGSIWTTDVPEWDTINNGKYNNTSIYEGKLRKVMEKLPFDPIKFKIPTLQIHGTADDIVAFPSSLRLWELLDKEGVKQDLIVAPDGQHCSFNSEYTGLFNDLFQQYLEKYFEGKDSFEKEENVHSGIQTSYSTIKSNLSNYIGKTTDWHTANYVTKDIDWNVLYADEYGLYLIADDFVNCDQIPTTKTGTKLPHSISGYEIDITGALNDYSGTDNVNNIGDWYLYNGGNYANSKCVDYLLDTKRWTDMYGGNGSTVAIGGPTMEMAYYVSRAVDRSANMDGGEIGTSGNPYGYKLVDDTFQCPPKTNKALYNSNSSLLTYMACPTGDTDLGIYIIDENGEIRGYRYSEFTKFNQCFGLRPIVFIDKTKLDKIGIIN